MSPRHLILAVLVLGLPRLTAPVQAAPRVAARDLVPEVPYAETIRRVSAREGVDPRLVRAVIQVESGYQADARSPKGAMGLMQLMPDTARRYALRNAYDPTGNITAGIRHLKSLLARFPRDLALAAYNAGETAVERFHGIPPFQETRDYVSRVLRLAGPGSTFRARMREQQLQATAGAAGGQRATSKPGTAKAPDPWQVARTPWRASQPIRAAVPVVQPPVFRGTPAR